jgi:hypothetical protein
MTRPEDEESKRGLYRDVLGVPEFFLIDPTQDYLRPPLQGFRLVGAEYVPIEPTRGRLRSEVLELDLGRAGEDSRFFDPETGRRLLKRIERADQARAEPSRPKPRSSMPRPGRSAPRPSRTDFAAKSRSFGAGRAAELNAARGFTAVRPLSEPAGLKLSAPL